MFNVKKAMVKINSELVYRYFILDQNMPVNEVNFYLDYKSFRSLNTGRQYAYYLCKYLNFLEKSNKNYLKATDKDFKRFLDYILWGNSNQTNVSSINGAISYNTLKEYVVVVTGFYRFLNDERSDEFLDKRHKTKMHRRIDRYQKIYCFNYGNYIDSRLRILKKKRVKIRWLDDELVETILTGFNTLRDKAIFLITVLCGARIGEVLSLHYDDFVECRRQNLRFIKPHESKGLSEGEARDLLLPENLCRIIDSYILSERAIAEQESGAYFTKELFITLRKGNNQGNKLTYNSYRKAFKQAVKRSGLDSSLFATHDGRRTKVMSLLKYQSEHGDLTDEMIRQIMGWTNPATINSYKNMKDMSYMKSILMKVSSFEK
ncbi:transposition regulatory protein, TnpA [Paenibacillus amylolyticus]|uniref:Transposition regulatory protein, TnpA n=1 Tax=Paenibacillus amylolyticus TaxID=1451 RepID=A0A100VNY1_PAEAM|nr:transposition regulatory protein, TnpA [Paenibacillus amylolyticus]